MSKRILSVVLSLVLLLTTVSVTGIITIASTEPVITPVTTDKAPEGNLLAGMRPVSGYSGQTTLSSNKGNPGMLTDGEFAAADNSTGRWVGYTSTGNKIVFNLGVLTEINQFLIGSEGGAAQYADKVKIYVSKTVVNRHADLFVEGNLAMDVTGLTAQNNLVSVNNKTFQAMMIGFDFTDSKANAGQLMRLGELGAYGTDKAAVTDTKVTPVTELPAATNLLAGVTPVNGYNGGSVGTCQNSNVAFLTDGKFCTTNTNTADRWCGWFGTGDKQVWDLGAVYDIEKFLVGSENGTNEYVKQVNIYVSNDKSKLFTDDSLVLSARGYETGIGANRDNLLSSKSDKKFTGQYVGFDFSNNFIDKTSADTAGFMQGFLRLGELGVYGTLAPKGPVRTPVTTTGDLPAGESLIAGVTPTKPDGTRLNTAHSTKHTNATDGLIQGINQVSAFKLTQDVKTATSGGNTYYSWIAPTALVEAQGLDTSKTWYIQPENGKWMASNTNEQRTVFYTVDPAPVYDMGEEQEIESIFIASSVEPAGLTNATYYNGAYDASKHPTMTPAQLEEALAPALDNRLLYKGKVYVSNDRANIIHEDNLVLEYDLSDNKAEALRNLWTLPESVKGRYVAFDFDGSSYYDLSRVSELAVYGKKSDAPKPYTLYNADNAAANMTPAADNVLAGAASTGYRTDKSGNTNDAKMLTKLVDGLISSQDSDKLCPTTGKDNGASYYYFTYDMGEDYTIDSLAFAGDGGDGANSVAVYVGDKDLTNVGSTEPDAFYNGGIGTTSRVTNNKTDAVAICFTFDQALTGRYITFRLGVCRNSNFDQVWVSEFAATGSKAGGGSGKAYAVIDDESDLPQDTNLIASLLPTKADGTKVNVHSGTLGTVTDGKIPGINQELPTFTLTQEDQYKTATSSGHTYYSWIAPTSLVEAQGLDTTKTWYMRPQSGRWLHTNGGEKSATLWSGADSRPVFDMGNTSTVKSLLFGSVTELTGFTNENYYDGAYDASKHLTMSDTQLTTASTPMSADKRLLWTAKVYVGDDRATIFDDSNKVLEFDLSDALNDAWCTLWTLPEAVQGRYVAFDLNDALYADLVRVSELAVYGDRVVQDLKPGVNVVSMANFPNIPANLLQGSTKQTGTLNKNTAPLEVLYDGNIGGINVAAGESTRVAFDGNSGGTITTVDGKTVTKVNGTVNVAFQLENTSTIDKFLVAGSAADSTNHVTGGVSYDNKNVLYYEIYVSDNYANLYSEANRVLYYNNSEDPQLALIHVLDTPVRGSYVGFKLSCGVYSLGRFSELGVYGTMDPLVQLPFTGFDSESEMKALVNGQKNLILGESVENKPLGYLSHFGSADLKNEEWLYDGYVDWTEVAEGESYKKNEYANSNSDQTIAYDLLGEVDFSGLLLSGIGTEESQFRPQRVNVYVSDDDKTLFASDNMVGVAMLRGANVGAYVDLSGVKNGRYVGLMIPGDVRYRIVRLAELGLYGTYVSGPIDYPKNLLSGSMPVYQMEIGARSIDNKTAVDVNGHPGSGNTGEFTGFVKKPWKHDDLSLLTDGSTSTRASLWSSASPTGAVHEQGSNILHYDSNWMVFVYKLGGGTRIDEIVYSSSPEPDYYISGVQYYASESYADLFKNESLLYTTGGEYYVVDEENSTEEETKYLPDASMDKNDSQSIEYALTDEQKATNYRYVAIVLTRPHSMWKPSSPANRLQGYSLFRAAEMAVYGEVVNPEEPIKDIYTVNTSVGEVTLQIGTLHFDDRAFFDNTLAGIKVTETKLPADVNPNTDDNWLSVDNDTVFTFQLVDKDGNPIPETAADEAKGLNGREIELQFPSTADYVQTMGVLEDGVLRRLYNSFTNIQKDRKINAGCLVYPVYEDSMPNNREKAVLTGTKVSLVYMKANGFATVNKLSNRVVNDSLADFVAAGGVDGASSEAGSVSPLWYVLPALAVAGAAAVTAVLLKRRKAFRDGQ